MGPRSFNRGKFVYQATSGGRDRGFNGASVFQPRKGGSRLGERRTLRGLQWGLGLSTEESSLGKHLDTGLDALQWGLGLSTEESPSPRLGLIHRVRLQWGLGLSTEESGEI